MGRAKSQLVIRSITTPGNYDYINNFVLDEDGTISVQMDFGGYMLASYARDAASNNEEYPMFGVPVGPHTNGVLHDHVVGYKVDLDIAGTSNSFQTTSIKYGTYEEATGKTKPAYISYNGIKYAENIIHPTELGVHAKDYDGYAVINEEALNAWGVPRGYEIVPLSTTARQVLPDDHPLMAAGGWMKHNIMVTVRKDEEELATVPSNFNIGVPTPERYNMDAFLNSEPIVKQDLVTWITVGRQHYPKAEDVPVVSNFGVGFSLKPRNFYAAAAFKDLPAAQETEYGARVEACAPPKQAPR